MVFSQRGSDGPNPTAAPRQRDLMKSLRVSLSLRPSLSCVRHAVRHTLCYSVPLLPKLSVRRNLNDPCFWVTEPRLTTLTRGCGFGTEASPCAWRLGSPGEDGRDRVTASVPPAEALRLPHRAAHPPCRRSHGLGRGPGSPRAGPNFPVLGDQTLQLTE